jgi:non-ribosomal peptide synthetase component F
LRDKILILGKSLLDNNLELLTKVKEWNATDRPYPRDRCIHQLFEDQSAKTPDAVAVVFEDQTLTYSQLNAKANQLAHYLREKGVGPDVPVGICMDRSLEMIIALYGILKAGGAYVPLDPIFPRDRIRWFVYLSRRFISLLYPILGPRRW